jgi:aminopeptidase Y
MSCAIALTAAPAAAQAQTTTPPTSSERLRQGVTLAGLTEHQRNLQNIANANGSTRATGTPGYEASVDYVVERLERAGYNVRTEPFNFPTWTENAPPVLEAGGVTYKPGTPADDDTPTPTSSPSSSPLRATRHGARRARHEQRRAADARGVLGGGCSAADFPAATRGAISLIQRGTCPFIQKLANAAAAGAVGVILYNEGNPGVPGRTNALSRVAPTDYPIPAVMSSYAVGKALLDTPNATAA